MHLERDSELPAVKVEDVVDIARAAGDVIMGVYSTDLEVRVQCSVCPPFGKSRPNLSTPVSTLVDEIL